MALPSSLKRNKDRFNAATSAVVGFDFTTLLTLLPTIIGLFQACKKQPPPNPQPSPTPAEQKAYEMNWHATTNYVGGKERYRKPAVNALSRQIRKSKKKDGTSISKDEAEILALASLDESRQSDIPTLAAAIEEAGA